MVIRSHFRTSSDAGKAPSVQLASERGELGRLEVFGQNITGKLFLLVNKERTAMWEPRNCIGIFLVAQNFVELE